MDIRKLIIEHRVAGQVRSFDFSVECWDRFCKVMGVSRQEVTPSFFKSHPIKALRTFVLCSVNAANDMNGHPPIEEKEVYEWMCEDPMGIVSLINEGKDMLAAYSLNNLN